MLEAFADCLGLQETVIFFRILNYGLILYSYFRQFCMRPVMIETVSRIKKCNCFPHNLHAAEYIY